MTTCICGQDTSNKKNCPNCLLPVVWTAKAPVKRELEASIKAKIRAALVSNGVLCWIHNVDNRAMHTGLGLGTSDIICVVPPHGRFLGIEVKRPKAKTNLNQDRWLKAVRDHGGVTGIATSVQEALALVEEARK